MEKTGPPYIITAHGSDVPGYNPDRFNLIHYAIRIPWRKIVHNSRMVISPSNFLIDLIKKHINIDVNLIPNGYNFKQDITPSKKNMILVVARMFERKGIQFFLKAIENLKTDWKIVIAGDGPYLNKHKEIEEFASAGRKRAQEFKWENIAAKYDALFKEYLMQRDQKKR